MAEHDALYGLRHSAAHMLAAAILKLYPGTKLGTGPVVENGFYYDVLPSNPITEEDLPKIEAVMREIIAGDHPFVRKPVTAAEAKAFFQDQPFKQELVEKFSADGRDLTLYASGPFTDLCEGNHAENTKQLRSVGFQLSKLAGAYWQADSTRPQMTRIYGVLFNSPKELKQYLHQIEEAKKRDHRKLGKELDLFTFSELVGAGLPLFTPRGTTIRRELENYISQLREQRGFQRVWIPHMAKSDLYKTSGHWDKFEDDLFHVHSKKTDATFVMKPMNCPHHTQIYASQKRSYKDLPIRFFETTTNYRDENTGQIQGLTRVRSLTQDDSHVFARVDQIQQEAELAQDIITELYSKFGLELRPRFSTHDPAHMENYLGTEEAWQNSESILRAVMESKGLTYVVGLGEAAFYGPKIDYMAVDSLGREWQLATIQLDVNQPERFDLTYTSAEGKEERPVMIHVAVMGSVERFMGVIIEHFAGNFPTWLAPAQAKLLPVSDAHIAYAQEVKTQLQAAGIRVEVDEASETVGNKIRKAVSEKVPYLVVVGEKEIEAKAVAVRKRGSKDTVTLAVTDFIAQVQTDITTKAIW
jgi:threonyl-tRNA synthetase